MLEAEEDMVAVETKEVAVVLIVEEEEAEEEEEVVEVEEEVTSNTGRKVMETKLLMRETMTRSRNRVGHSVTFKILKKSWG